MYDQALSLIPWQATCHQFRAEALYNLARALPEDETDLKAELLEAAGRGMARARRLEPLELEHYSNSGVVHTYWSEAVDPAREVFRAALGLAPGCDVCREALRALDE